MPDTITDTNGRFLLGPLPRGEFSLSTFSSDNPPTEPVTVSAGDLGVRIELAAGQVIVGCAIDARTEERLRVESVAILDEGPRRAISWGAGADPFRFTGLARGRYALLAKVEGGRIALATDVAAPSGSKEDPVRIRADLGAKLTFVGPSDGWRTVHVFLGSLLVATVSVPTKRTVTELLPAGSLRLETRTPSGESATEIIQLSAGETRTLSLR